MVGESSGVSAWVHFQLAHEFRVGERASIEEQVQYLQSQG